MIEEFWQHAAESSAKIALKMVEMWSQNEQRSRLLAHPLSNVYPNLMINPVATLALCRVYLA
jgi:hypothetical protein